MSISGIRGLCKEPLLHFLLIGAILFLVYDLGQESSSESLNEIRIDAGQVEQLVAGFSRTWLRPPNAAELDKLIDGRVRDEIYYREALSMGLDQNDAVIRQRMRIKLDFMLQDLTGAEAPTDEQLTRFLDEHPDKFREEPEVAFLQVYLNPDKHADLATKSTQLLADLQAGAAPETAGDSTLLALQYRLTRQSELAREFGDKFAQRLGELRPGGWSGPIYSGFGAHLVRVLEKQDARLPQLNEIRAQVAREYQVEQEREMKDAVYQQLRTAYEVVIAPDALLAIGVTGLDTEPSQ
jgi:hypothetical protein